MTLEQIEGKITNLSKRINGFTNEKGEHVPGINDWIKSNPQVTDPNAYEIMDCNVEYAECIAELVAYYNANGWPQVEPTAENEWPRSSNVQDIPRLHPSLGTCFFGICEMEALRNIENHSFFKTKEANDMLCAVKLRQLSGTYTLGKTETDKRIKRELLCKSMSVPFYIWQVHRTEPNYQYDNITEFEGMKGMLALYETSETPCQFKPQIDNLFKKIDSDYKYSTSRQVQPTSQK